MKPFLWSGKAHPCDGCCKLADSVVQVGCALCRDCVIEALNCFTIDGISENQLTAYEIGASLQKDNEEARPLLIRLVMLFGTEIRKLRGWSLP